MVIEPVAAALVVIFAFPSIVPPVTVTAPAVEIGASIDTRAVLLFFPIVRDECAAPAKPKIGFEL